MTPRHVDADAWRLLCILLVGGWLSLDPSPLGWPYYWWLVGFIVAVWVYCELGGSAEDLDAAEGDLDEF